jgi:S1-C subfamily serine protease
MQPFNPSDPNYQLIPPSAKPAAPTQWRNKAWLTGLVALALILAAFYAPILWQEAPVSAAAGARMQQAQSLQIDASLLQDQAALAQLYEQVAPSVVSIQVTGRAENGMEGFQLPNLPGLPNLPEGDAPLQRGEGSGFLYDNEGHIVTNNHVVEDATDVNVVFADGHWVKAKVVATDPQADLAVLKVTPPNGMAWRPLSLAQPDSVKVGHTVLALGNPFGLENTMTTGIVSALGRGMPVGQFGANRYTLPDVIQTDAAINPGNSGGPLINLAGEVVGVNFAIESATRSNSGVGFTIPVSIVRRVVPALIESGKFDYAYLGLSGVTIGPDVAEQLELSNEVLGVYVGSVVSGGPADKAGVQGGDRGISTNGSRELAAGGDIITAINDQPVRYFEELVSYLVTKASPGETVTLTILRDGDEIKADVVLGTRPGLSDQARLGVEGPVNARQAVAIARDTVQGELEGDITQTFVSPDERNGQRVWVVELGNDSQTATVIISQATGEVLEMSVK